MDKTCVICNINVSDEKLDECRAEYDTLRTNLVLCKDNEVIERLDALKNSKNLFLHGTCRLEIINKARLAVSAAVANRKLATPASSNPDLVLKKNEKSLPEDESKLPRKKRKSTTRSTSNVFLVGQPMDRIAGSQLPTGRQAFRYYLHIKSNAHTQTTLDELAYQVVDAILIFWNMARIKTITRKNSMIKFKRIVENHRQLAKSKDRKGDPHGLRKKFEEGLDSLFDIGAEDVEEDILKNRLLDDETKAEDIAFYKDQQTLRKSRMSGHDKIFETKAWNKIIRENRQLELLIAKNAEDVSTTIDINDDMDMDIVDDDHEYEDNDTSFTHSYSTCTKDKRVLLEFSRDIMEDEGICAAADRLGMSDNQVTAVVVAVLKAGGADVMKDFNISRSTTRRKRICARLNVMETNLATFEKVCPDKCILHWDGKGLRHTLGSDPEESEEYLAVLVTGVPDYEEGKHR